MVNSTGITLPRMDSIWALYALQKSMMLTPCGPSAVPTGGAGVAAPAWSCTLTSAAIFFLGGIASCVLLRRTSWSSRAGPALPPGVLLGVADAARLAGQPHHCGPAGAGGEIYGPGSDPLDLAEAQLDRGLPTEDLDQRLDPLGLGVDLGDRRVQRGERAVDDHDRVRDVEVGDLDLLLRGAGTRLLGRRGLRLGDDRGRQHALHL